MSPSCRSLSDSRWGGVSLNASESCVHVKEAGVGDKDGVGAWLMASKPEAANNMFCFLMKEAETQQSEIRPIKAWLVSVWSFHTNNCGERALVSNQHSTCNQHLQLFLEPATLHPGTSNLS